MPAQDCCEFELWGVISGRPKASRNMGLSVMVSAGALNVTIFISLSRLPSCEGASSSSCANLGNLHADSSRSLFTPNRRFSSQESVRSPRWLVLPDQWHRGETSV
jgi:hypothetical protein